MGIGQNWQSTPEQIASSCMPICDGIIQGQVSQEAPVNVQVFRSFGSEQESWRVHTATDSFLW